MPLGSSYDRDRTRYPKTWDYEPEEVPEPDVIGRYTCDGCGLGTVEILDANGGKDNLCPDCYREWQEESREESVLLDREVLISL